MAEDPTKGAPPAAPAPAAAPAPSPAVPAPADPNAPAPSAFWPDTWREKWAGEDEKKLSRLSRYASPEAAFDALSAMQHRLSTGELKFPLGKDATPEQLSAWRKEVGVPEAPDKYDIKPKNGEAIGETDKKWIDDLAKAAHAGNISNQQMNAVIDWYYDWQDREVESRHTADLQFKQQTEDQLRTDWGNDYRPNVNRIKALVDGAPAEIREELHSARLGNGEPMMSHPAVLKWLASMALELNPAATVVPGATGDLGGAIQDELDKLTKLMGDKGSDYWKGPKAAQMQQRYRDLVDAKDKMGRRAA